MQKQVCVMETKPDCDGRKAAADEHFCANPFEGNTITPNADTPIQQRHQPVHTQSAHDKAARAALFATPLALARGLIIST